jgi:hypothetical protein
VILRSGGPLERSERGYLLRLEGLEPVAARLVVVIAHAAYGNPHLALAQLPVAERRIQRGPPRHRLSARLGDPAAQLLPLDDRSGTLLDPRMSALSAQGRQRSAPAGCLRRSESGGGGVAAQPLSGWGTFSGQRPNPVSDQGLRLGAPCSFGPSRQQRRCFERRCGRSFVVRWKPGEAQVA